MAGDSRPDWAARIKREREARGWSQARAVANLRATYARRTRGKDAGSQESLLRQWKDWEAGRVKPQHWAPYIAEAFGGVTADFFPAPKLAEDSLIAQVGIDTAELVARLNQSSVDATAIRALRVTTDRLCTEYRHRANNELRTEGQEWLRQVSGLLDHRMTYQQHGELLSIAGMLALLVGCVEYDSGQQTAAETTRRFALELGTELDDHNILGWAHEMAAWFALTSGDLHNVVAASEIGIEIAHQRSVSVQLAAQAAKAWARLGNRRGVEVALDRGRALLESLPRPENPDHHFQVDPSKWQFYEMDAYRILAEDHLAVMHAEQVIREGSGRPGQEGSPMRSAEARLTLAVAAARAGDVEGAAGQGIEALSGPRRSLPSLLMVGRELAHEMAYVAGDDDPTVGDYVATLRDVAHSYDTTADNG